MTVAIRGATAVLAPIVVLLPLIRVKGPFNTAPVDALNVALVIVYCAWLSARRESVALPFLTAMWLIAVGSLGGLWATPGLLWSSITTVRGLYLYVWFVVLVDFVARTRSVPVAARVWVVTAALLAVAAAADRYGGLAGGVLLESAQRAEGTFENPNMFGNYLVVSFFLAWAVAAAGQPRLYLALPALAAGILATGSNGALLSLLSGSAAVGAVWPRRHPRRDLGRALLVAGLALALVGPMYRPITLAATDLFRGERGAPGGAVLKGYEERTVLWTEALATLEHFPAGAGPGSFEYLSGQVNGTYNSAHNDYLGMLVERGPLGLAGWCALLVAAWQTVRRLQRAPAPSPLAPRPLCGLVVAVAVHAGVVELFHFRHVWFVFALVVAAAIEARAETIRRPRIVLGRSLGVSRVFA